MRSKLKNNPINNGLSGFTLIELLVGIFIISISVLAVYQMFISGSEMLTEEYHRRLGLERAQAKMELAQSYNVATDSVPRTMSGTFNEPLIPPEEGQNEGGIPATYTITVTPSAERSRDNGKPVYYFVTLEYRWFEPGDEDNPDREQKIVLQSYF